MRKRILLLSYLMFWLFFFLALRLFQVQVVQAGRFGAMARMQHTEKIRIPAVRGRIYDRHGELWAMSMSGYSVAAFPRKIRDCRHTARRLSPILGVKPESLEKLLSSPDPFVWLSRKIDREKVAEIKDLALQGVEVLEEPTGKRVYPKGGIACHVLGYTGVDDQGLDGIELYYDEQLRGKPGQFLAETDGLGRVLPEGICRVVPAVAGASLTLTLDETLQYLAEKELEKAVRASQAKGGSMVVMNPENGEILALANYPRFSSSRYYAYPREALRNRAVTDGYEPGSTFKGILAAAALESGKVTLEDRFLSGPYLAVGGWRIRNADDGVGVSNPQQNLETILKYSLNVGAASVALRIGPEAYSDMMRRLGFYSRTGIDLPGEAGSLIPEAGDLKGIGLATVGFGQGLTVTPLQLATAYAILANGGTPVRPHLVKKISFPDGSEMTKESRKSTVRILRPETAETLRFLLQQVVTRGTGKRAAVPGYTTAGKTGTAQISRNGRYLSGAYVASFVGFVPVEKPVLLILVKVDEPRPPYWGGAVAAPVFKNVASQALWHLQIPPSAGMIRYGSWKVWGEEEMAKPRKNN